MHKRIVGIELDKLLDEFMWKNIVGKIGGFENFLELLRFS